MRRNDDVIFVKADPGTLAEAWDGVLVANGYLRVAIRVINEDWTPMLHEPGEPLAFVISPQRGEWVACWSSLALAAEWDLAEALARGLEVPLISAVFDPDRNVYAYRAWDAGSLRAEALPGTGGTALTEAGLVAELRRRGIDQELIDDRREHFAEEHVVLGYVRAAGAATGSDGESAKASP